MFTLFICDFLDALKGCSGVMLTSRRIPGLMFVDDLALLAVNPMDLQSALDVLHEYCLEWALSVNQNKTKVLVFGNKPFSFTWTYDESPSVIISLPRSHFLP